MESGENDTPSRGGASNIIPFNHPNAPAVKLRRVPQLRPKPVLCLDSAKLTRLPPQIKQALEAVPKPRSVSRKRFIYHWLRLPYGRWITKDGTKVLYNRRYEPLFIWRAGAERPERCKPHWVDDTVEEGCFYSDGSADRVGRSKLVHTIDAVIHAWERADRADADLLKTWLLDKHRRYLEITEAHGADVAKRREERKLFRDLMDRPA